MRSPWRRAFSLRLLDADGRLIVPWGWALVGLLITAAAVAYDLTDAPSPNWRSQGAARAAAAHLLAQLPDRPALDPELPVAFVSDRYGDAYANRLVSGKRGVPLPDALPIWSWRVPLRGGQGYVAVNAVTDAVTGLDLPQAREMPALAGVAALDAAQGLARRVGVGGPGWEGPVVQPGSRGDVYTWRSQGNALGEAPEVAEITVQGGRPVQLRRYLAVPDSFKRELDVQEQRGSWLARGVLGWVELLAALSAAILAFVYRRRAHWGFGYGVAAVFLVLAVLSGLNSSLVSQMLQTPRLAPGAVAIGTLALVVIGQSVHTLWLLFGGAAGWAMAQAEWGDRVALLAGGVRRLLGREGAVAGLRAYGLFVVHYQLAFWFYYFAEKRLGVWEATGLAFQQRFNLVLPALYPLQVAILAPLMEEVLWRLFAISALRRLFRLTFPAVLLPAALWGLAHSWYQVYPPYTRAIELTLVGLLLGYALVYWGLEVSIGSHLLYNALVTCVGLATVPLAGHRAGALLAGALLLLPAVPVALQLWRQRREAPAG